MGGLHNRMFDKIGKTSYEVLGSNKWVLVETQLSNANSTSRQQCSKWFFFLLVNQVSSGDCEGIRLMRYTRVAPIRAPERWAMWLTYPYELPLDREPTRPVDACASCIT